MTDQLNVSQRARGLIADQLRAVDADEPESGYGAMADDLMQGDLMQVPTWVALECVQSALSTNKDETIAKLLEHIAEQITHAETRIQDGRELGASVWRIALEDIIRENRALLTSTKKEG